MKAPGRALAVALAVIIGGTATCVVVSWPFGSSNHEAAARALIAGGPVTACCRGGSDRQNEECAALAETRCGWIRESRVVKVEIHDDCANTCKRAEIDLDGPSGKGHCTYLQIDGPANGGCHLAEPKPSSQPPPATRD